MSFIAGAATCFSWLAAVLMLFQVSLDILGKFLFGTPVPGTAEVVASYYMIALVFMALPLIEKRQDAIVVDLLYERFGPRLQRVCRIAALVFTLVFYLAFAWITFGIAMKSMAIREVIIGSREFLVWPSRFFLPAGCVLAAVVVILRQFVPVEDTAHDSIGAA
ncbi:TRAP transporter small permease subunit [Albibacillus kandeliae]|uniref:TRAP transporter small permease subunit n=1 Tax=Albibacillus kandeliae TaxID=2174228 RepID=UPI000D68ACAD|nr:TRAP transporter small permease [Albibacillus kandeliae]